MKTIYSGVRALLLCAVTIFAHSALTAGTTLSQHGITWEFSTDVQHGQYANGDIWVVGPASIIKITPGSTDVSGRIINGSMINPVASEGQTQGFDSAMYGTYGPSYNAALNAARPNGNDLSTSNPLNLPAGSSLVSTISHGTAGQRPQLTSAAILTVVQSPPPADSFRPPYQGTDKTHKWNAANLDYTLLHNFSRPSGMPSLATLESHVARPWIEINTSWTGRYMHPSQNQPDYGRDIATRLGTALLGLHCDHGASKRALYISLVQYGIDVYGAAHTGGRWRDLGGHNQGRKMPLVLAGLALKSNDILAYADAKQHFIFQEDRQTWFVTQADVGRILYTADGRPREQYVQSDVGIAEWGEQHSSQSNRDGRNWNAYYRDIVGSSVLSHALMAHLTKGAKEAWNWSPFFEYIDRFWALEKDSTTSSNPIPSLHKTAWNELRTVLDILGADSSKQPPTNATVVITVSN